MKEALGEEALPKDLRGELTAPRTGWTWERGRDEYLAHIKSVKPEKTYVDYRNRLFSPWLRGRWDGRLLADLTDEDVKRL